MDTTTRRRLDALTAFLMAHYMAGRDCALLVNTLFDAVADVCDPQQAEQVRQRFEAILTDAFPPTPPKH